jgi:hypothetical protein
MSFHRQGKSNVAWQCISCRLDKDTIISHFGSLIFKFHLWISEVDVYFVRIALHGNNCFHVAAPLSRLLMASLRPATMLE